MVEALMGDPIAQEAHVASRLVEVTQDQEPIEFVREQVILAITAYNQAFDSEGPTADRTISLGITRDSWQQSLRKRSGALLLPTVIEAHGFLTESARQ